MAKSRRYRKKAIHSKKTRHSKKLGIQERPGLKEAPEDLLVCSHFQLQRFLKI